MTEQPDFSTFGPDLNVAVIGASGGIGGAVTQLLASAPRVDRVLAFSRSDTAFEQPKITAVHIDIANEASIEHAASIARDSNPLDIVFVASGVLHNASGLAPEKSLRDLSQQNLSKVYEINTIGPTLVAKHFLPLLRRDRKSVFATISARVGSISDNRLGGWYAYRASKSALNQVTKTAAIEMNRRNKNAVVVGLHPGTVDTHLSKPFQGNVQDDKLFTPEFSARQMLVVLNGLEVSDSGNVFAWDGKTVPP